VFVVESYVVGENTELKGNKSEAETDTRKAGKGFVAPDCRGKETSHDDGIDAEAGGLGRSGLFGERLGVVWGARKAGTWKHRAVRVLQARQELPCSLRPFPIASNRQLSSRKDRLQQCRADAPNGMKVLA
jgi:hypothetical protein